MEYTDWTQWMLHGNLDSEIQYRGLGIQAGHYPDVSDELRALVEAFKATCLAVLAEWPYSLGTPLPRPIHQDVYHSLVGDGVGIWETDEPLHDFIVAHPLLQPWAGEDHSVLPEAFRLAAANLLFHLGHPEDDMTEPYTLPEPPA